MKDHKRRKGTAVSIPEGIAWGACTGITIILMTSAALAKLMDAQTLQWENVGWWIMTMLLLASFIGAMVSCGMIKRKRMQMSLLSGAILWLMLLGFTALFFGGQYEGVGVTGGLVLAGSISAGLTGSKPKKGRKGKKLQNTRC